MTRGGQADADEQGSGMNRKPRFAIAVTVVFFVLLYLPIAAVVLFSFNDKKSLTVFDGCRCAGMRPSSTTPT